MSRTRQAPGPPIADILEIPHRPRLAGHEGNGLRGVKGRTAAKGDDPVMAAGAIDLEAVLDIFADWVALNVGKEPGRNAGSLVAGDGVLDHGQTGQSRVGHQQRALHPQGLAMIGQFLDPAAAEFNRGGIVPIAFQGGGILAHERGPCVGLSGLWPAF